MFLGQNGLYVLNIISILCLRGFLNRVFINEAPRRQKFKKGFKKFSPFRANRYNLHVNRCDLIKKMLFAFASSAADGSVLQQQIPQVTLPKVSIKTKIIQTKNTWQTKNITIDSCHEICDCFHWLPPCQGSRLLSASQLFCMVGGGRSEEGEGAGQVPAAASPLLSCTPAWCLPSPELVGVSRAWSFRAVWVTYGMGTRAWLDAVGWNERGKRAKVTGACPPSPTARTPSPRPLHLKANRRIFIFPWIVIVHRQHEASEYAA